MRAIATLATVLVAGGAGGGHAQVRPATCALPTPFDAVPRPTSVSYTRELSVAPGGSDLVTAGLISRAWQRRNPRPIAACNVRPFLVQLIVNA